jgi:hypothetical protein
VSALLTRIPMLAKLIEGETADSFDLSNGTTIEVHPVSMRTTRGYTVVAALCDEIAFWPHEDAAEPHYEVLNALRTGMATIPSAMLLCASSPYARHFGKDNDPILVCQADTRTMNPFFPQQVIDTATEQDSASAAAEWLAHFRSDAQALLTCEAVQACISFDLRERAPMQSVRYFGFVDPSGGSADSMTLAIGHQEHDIVIVDALREIKPPFSPESVVSTPEELSRQQDYRRRYAGEWPRERFPSMASSMNRRKNRNRICIATCCLRLTAASSTSWTARAS